jgi:hypothetical protein
MLILVTSFCDLCTAGYQYCKPTSFQITMNHFDLPQHLQDLGGWTNPALANYFEDYACVLYTNFGDRVNFCVIWCLVITLKGESCLRACSMLGRNDLQLPNSETDCRFHLDPWGWDGYPNYQRNLGVIPCQVNQIFNIQIPEWNFPYVRPRQWTVLVIFSKF